MDSNVFEKVISELTLAVDGQYPRPWTCDFKEPLKAEGMILGFNQARKYSSNDLTHEEFMDYHFGRCGTSYDLYNRLNPDPSPTRENIAKLAKQLDRKVLESDVYCYSSRKSKDLSASGREIGRKLAHTVIAGVAPKFMIVYGAKPEKAFWKELQKSGAVIEKTEALSEQNVTAFRLKLDRARLNANFSGSFDTLVLFIPSLSLPQWNKWKWEAPAVFTRVEDLLQTID